MDNLECSEILDQLYLRQTLKPEEIAINIGGHVWIVSKDHGTARMQYNEKEHRIYSKTITAIDAFPIIIDSVIVFCYNDSSITFSDGDMLYYVKIDETVFKSSTVSFKKNDKQIICCHSDVRIRTLIKPTETGLVPVYIDYERCLAYCSKDESIAIVKFTKL